MRRVYEIAIGKGLLKSVYCVGTHFHSFVLPNTTL